MRVINNSSSYICYEKIFILSLVLSSLLFGKSAFAAYDYYAINPSRLIFSVNDMYCFNINDAVDTLATPVACTSSLSSYIFGVYYATFDLFYADVASSIFDLTNFSSVIEPNGVSFEMSVTGVRDYRYGCIDPSALNYDPEAEQSDSSCTYPVYGCTDSTATNYEVNATAGDPTYFCTYPAPIPGCTDSSALNYDPNATIGDPVLFCLYF